MKAPADQAKTFFWQGPSGQRFQDRYWRHREKRHHRPMAVRIALLTLGAVLAVLGFLMLILPGPGILCLALAGGLFASESLRIARFLDWIDARLRAAWKRVRERWGRGVFSKPR
jgi:hypothetical protein